MSVELECAGMKGGLESGDKLAAEDTAEHFDGKEEGAARGDPAGVVRSEAAGGKHAVDMGMMLQSLVPGMEHAEEADLGSKMPGIASDLQQSCSTGVKQRGASLARRPGPVSRGSSGHLDRDGRSDRNAR